MRGETVVVHRRVGGTADAHGNATATWTDVEVAGAFVWRGVTEEPVNNRDRVDTEINVALPDGTQIAALDEMTVRGDRYPVLGDPFTWVNPYTASRPGVQVRLGRVEG